MAYPAVAIKIAVASPGDTGEERACAREVIFRWNVLHAENYELVLMPIGWETHATPAMGKPAQDIINDNVIDDADILIGVFGSRLGTPTANAPSGTVEEIQRHVDSGKPAMVYFSTKSIPRDQLDVDQLTGLKEFEDECKSKGLIDYFTSTDEFREKLDRHLTQTVNRKILKDVGYKGQNNSRLEPSLSEDAETLLLALAADDDGYIYCKSFVDGAHMRVAMHENVFADGTDRRASLRWEAAVDELYEHGYTDGGSANQVIHLVNAGLEKADQLLSANNNKRK